MTDFLPDFIEPERRRGRGAGQNPPSRYDRQTSQRVDDGWQRDPDAPVRTRVDIDQSRTILAKNQSPDVPFERSINPYRGCEHGCIYCFARITHAHLGLSPGLDFETRLCSPSRVRLNCWRKRCGARAISASRLRWGPIPTPTSPSRRTGASCAASWRFCGSIAIR